MTKHDTGLLYMLAFCLLLALVMLLRSTPPPPKHAVVIKDGLRAEEQSQQERNIKNSK